jgi:outer membrane protein assembly factor BamB
VGAWLVKISADDRVRTATYSSLIPDAPKGSDSCLAVFSPDQLPWPPSPTAVPPSVPCGSQRAGINVAPAVGPDDTIYTVSRAHLTGRTGYLVAVRADLTTRWAASLRDRLRTGCNVLLPANGTPGGCRAGAADGVDPAQNRPGAGRVLDDSTSSPTVTPDGSILYGAYTRFNYNQGHLMKFSANGTFLTSYPFGWDITPAIFQHGHTHSAVIKENRYLAGSYCDVDQFCPAQRSASDPAGEEGFFITQLDSDLRPEWRFRNTNTESCSRDVNGNLVCVADHPQGFEWCVNAAAVDVRGVVYANSEDGAVYAINQGGTLRASLFLQTAQNAAYTPLSIGADGKLYCQNDGHLFVVGR